MVFPRTDITKSAQETSQSGEALGRYLIEERGNKKTAAGCVCLYGDLGSGKTTFVQGFARALGITGRLLSPTYIIVRRYQLKPPLRFFYHIDLYRLQAEIELGELGLAEILRDRKSFVAIEWAEKLGNLMPERRLDIHFRVLHEGEHEITIKGTNF